MAASRRLTALGIITLLASGAPALAHHPMDRMLPATLSQGLLSGLGHPVIGLDHLAFIVACGVIASAYRQALFLPLAFVAASSAGALLHYLGYTLPWSEGAIAVSLMCLGALLALRSNIPAGVAAGLFALAGLFHGYALFESIVGAETTPLVAYVAGLVVSQYGVALLAILAVRALRKGEFRGLAVGQRAYGGSIAAFGLVTLISQQVA